MLKNYSLKIYKGFEGFLELLPSWNSSLDSHHKIFDCPDFYKAVLENLAFDEKELYFFLVLEDDQPIAIFPLLYGNYRIWKIRNKVLELPNHSHFNNTDFIFFNGAHQHTVFQYFISALKKQNFKFDLLNLKEFSEGSSIENILMQSKMKRKGLHSQKYAVLSLKSYEKILENLSSNFRRNLRRTNNKIARDGDYEFRCSREGFEIEKLFEEFMYVEASGWKGKKGTAIKLHKSLKDYYTTLLKNNCSNHSLEIFILKHKTNTVGGIICIESGNTIYLPKIAYNEEYKSISPGHLLIDHVLQKYSADPKFTCLNFYSSTNWVEVWKPSFKKVYTEFIFNNTLKGNLSFNLLNFIRWFDK